MTSPLYRPLLFIIFVTEIYAVLHLSSPNAVSRSGRIEIAIVDGMALQSYHRQNRKSSWGMKFFTCVNPYCHLPKKI